MNRFQKCLEVVLGNEGGVSDVKEDRGGLTSFGVTQKTYDQFCTLTGRAKKSVSSISREEVELIYGSYWKDAHCDYIPVPLDCQMFDAAINHGPKRAIKLLQLTLGVDDDGVCGRQTMTALHEEVVAIGIEKVCSMYLDNRESFYDRIILNDPSQSVFATGWINRVDHMRTILT